MKIKNLTQNGLILIFTIMVGNVLNFGFSAILGRVTSLEDFSVFTVVNAFYYLLTIFLAALGLTTNHWVAFLSLEKGNDAGIIFFRGLQRNVFLLSLGFSVLWLAFSPFLQSFFRLPSILPVISFIPLIIAAPYEYLSIGFHQGKFLFLGASCIVLSEAISRILLAGGIYGFHYPNVVYLAVPFSVCCSAFIAFLFNRIISKPASSGVQAFPKRFFLGAMMTGVASSAFLSADIIIVKHFVSATIAGEYAILSLVGKMIYFFGAIGNSVLISYITRDETKGKNIEKSFHLFLFSSLILTSLIFLLLGPLGPLTVPVLFGVKSARIIQYLLPYALGIAFFTISNTFINFHLTLHQYSYSGISLLATGGMVIGISLFHNGIGEIVQVILTINICFIFVVSCMHFLNRTKTISSSVLYVT